MSTHDFLELDFQFGEYIYIENEKGEGFFGSYENEFDISTESFKFVNHSNGRTEKVTLSKVNLLRRT